MEKFLVTIDGPSAAGKTTVSKLLSEELGFIYVDTGALYRSTALYITENGIPYKDERDVESSLDDINIEMLPGKGVLLNGRDVSGRIRTPEISMAASRISSFPCIRSFLLDIQKNIGAKKNAVFEGRDMGTVVFPDAEVKFFLTATPEIRAKRRFLQMGGDGSDQSLDEVLKDLVKRDNADSGRAVAPLKPAEDAVFVDSSEIDAQGVKEHMLNIIKNRIS